MINDFLGTLEPIVSDSESSEGEQVEVKKSVSLHVFGGNALKPVEKLLVCNGSTAAVRCGVNGLGMEGPVDSLRVDYVPSASSAVLTIPNRCSNVSIDRIVWEHLKPKEVVVATTREVSSTRGVDGIVYDLGSANSEYPALPLGEAIDGPIAEIITNCISRKVPVEAYVLYHGPHPDSSVMMKLGEAVSSQGDFDIDSTRVHDSFIKLRPTLDNRVSVYM